MREALIMPKVRIQNYPMVSPMPGALIGAIVNGKPNYVTVGAFGVVCQDPVFYISLKESHYTTGGVKENGWFSINVPGPDLVQKADYCGMVSGKTTDKSGLFTTFYDERGNAPLIMECPLSFLCKVVQTMPFRGFEVFFAEIVATYLDERCLTDGKPDPVKINPLILMGTHYHDLGRVVGSVFKEANSL